MTEKDVDVENSKELVTVSVFERESEEYIEEKEHGVELIDFVSLEDIMNGNGEYVSVSAKNNKPELIPRLVMSSSCMDPHTGPARKGVFTIVACVLCILL